MTANSSSVLRSDSSVPSSAQISRAEMGGRLRAARKSRNLTLKTLSDRTGVALSTLSKMELGQVAISFEKFAAVAKGLDLDISRLFDAASPGIVAAPIAPSFVHSSIAEVPVYVGDHYQYRMLAGDYPNKHMLPVHGRVLARRLEEFPDFGHHAGQEFLMVLVGTVQICFETGESVDLQQGESIYFDSSIGHVYLSHGKGEAEVIILMHDR
jgi:transcriptional regulator with XRE-family HTH domain